MAVFILDPAGDGNIQEGTFVGGSSDYTNVLRPDDDDTSYITVADTAGNRDHSVYLTKLPPASAISQVTIFHRFRRTGGSTWFTDVGMRDGTTNSKEGEQGNHPTTWQNRTSAAITRPGGGSYVGGDFPGGGSTGMQLLMSVGSSSGGGAVGGYTTVYANVTFTPAAGGFAYLVQCWLPPLIVGASHGLSFREIQEFFSQFKGRPDRRSEYELIQRELLRRPRFAFLGEAA